MTRLDAAALTAADLADWRKLAQALHAHFRIADPPDLRAGLAFAAAVADAVDTPGRFPRVAAHGWGVDVSLATHDDGLWVTDADVEAARAVSALAAEHGLRPDPTRLVQVEFGLDTADAARLGPFWAAIYFGDAGEVTHGEVFDPTGAVPNIWFQGTDAHEPPRQRWHPDVWVAPESVQPRIDAAVAAGGTVVDSSEGPSFTVLADPDGNKVCLCTYLDRD